MSRQLENQMMTVLSVFWLITAVSSGLHLLQSNPKIFSFNLAWGIGLTVFQIYLAGSFYKLSHGQNVGDAMRLTMIIVSLFQAFSAITTLLHHPLNILDWAITVCVIASLFGVWHDRQQMSKSTVNASRSRISMKH